MGNSSNSEEKEVITCWNDDKIERHIFHTIDRETMSYTSGKRHFDMKHIYLQNTNNVLIIARMIETNAVAMCSWKIQTYFTIYNLNMDKYKINHVCDTQKNSYKSNEKNDCFQTNFMINNSEKCFIKTSQSCINKFNILNEKLLNENLYSQHTKDNKIIGFINQNNFILIYNETDKILYITHLLKHKLLFKICDHNYTEFKSLVMDSNDHANIIALSDNDSNLHFYNYDIGQYINMETNQKENKITEISSYQTIVCKAKCNVRCIKFNSSGTLLAVSFIQYDNDVKFFYSVYMQSKTDKLWQTLFTKNISDDNVNKLLFDGYNGLWCLNDHCCIAWNDCFVVTSFAQICDNKLNATKIKLNESLINILNNIFNSLLIAHVIADYVCLKMDCQHFQIKLVDDIYDSDVQKKKKKRKNKKKDIEKLYSVSCIAFCKEVNQGSGILIACTNENVIVLKPKLNNDSC